MATETATAPKVKIATVWLDGCSGCHMSFLDIDQKIIELAGKIELVYSPLVDAKEYPEGVDVCLIEGAVSTEEEVEKVKKIRKRTKCLISLGDCAVTGNVPSMRNAFGVDAISQRAYFENARLNQQMPTEGLPKLRERLSPVHEVVQVDVFVPGCPPPAEAIWHVVTELLAGRTPEPSKVTRFGK